MKPPNALQVSRSIDMLPRQSNSSIQQVLTNARRLGIEPLAQACQEELQARGTLTLSTKDAEQASEIGARVAGKTLSEIIRLAFEEVPPNPEELLILRWISQHPGTSYADLGRVHQKRDLSLVIGHLVYHRFGYFRPVLATSVQSDVLLERDKSSGKVCYTLRPEAREAFGVLGILE